MTGSAVVLKRTQVRLPTLGEEFEISKILDTATDTPSTRATNAAGAPIDSQRKLADETRAYLRRHRQIHPVLSRAMSTAGNNRINVLIWLYVNEEIYDKGADREGPPVGGPRVATTEAMTVDPRPRPGPPPDQPPEPRMIGYRRQVDAVVEQAMRQLPETTGVRIDRPRRRRARTHRRRDARAGAKAVGQAGSRGTVSVRNRRASSISTTR